MDTGRGRTVIAAMLFALAGVVAMPARATAHCDSMDGPVVKAAQKALATGVVAHALAWVRAQDEPEIRAAFARTIEVRKHGGEASNLADLWFFETLVRVHRQGEGEPYTGLKPAGAAPAPGVAAADSALEARDIASLATAIAEESTKLLRQKFERVLALREHDPLAIDAARDYVHAYVDYIHFVENLHAAIHGTADSHAASTRTGHAH